MRLAQYAISYLADVGASPKYSNLVRGVVRRLNVDIADLSPTVINQFLADELCRYATSTCRTHRNVLLAIFNHASRDGVVNDCTGRVRKVKRRQTVPRAWSHDELVRLYRSCGSLRGRFRRAVDRSQCMQAAVLFGYATAFRLSDICGVRHDALRGKVVSLVAQKTGRVQTVMLTEEAEASVQALPRIGSRVFGDFLSAATFLRWFRVAVKEAGLTGTPRYLRRSSATYACIAGIDPTGHLGHATPQMARLHYLDPSLLAANRPAVPQLLGCGAVAPASGHQLALPGTADKGRAAQAS